MRVPCGELTDVLPDWGVISWPVHEDPQRRILEIDRALRCVTTNPRRYDALAEHDYFRERFDLRTPAEIEALRVRP
jgi:hypothetical protein